MIKKTVHACMRYIAFVLVFTMLLPVAADAAEPIQPRGSYYLDNYGAYVYLPGNGVVQVYFDVTGMDYMDELGVLTIQIYECATDSSYLDDWVWKKTFTHDSTPGMLSYNDDFHAGHVTYQGTQGKYYKAYICVWGGKDGDGDTRYFWTSAKH